MMSKISKKYLDKLQCVEHLMKNYQQIISIINDSEKSTKSVVWKQQQLVANGNWIMAFFQNLSRPNKLYEKYPKKYLDKLQYMEHLSKNYQQIIPIKNGRKKSTKSVDLKLVADGSWIMAFFHNSSRPNKLHKKYPKNISIKFNIWSTCPKITDQLSQYPAVIKNRQRWLIPASSSRMGAKLDNFALKKRKINKWSHASR